MPAVKRFEIRRKIDAPRERVWQAVLDLMSGPDGRPDYAVEGNPPPHGPGAVKVFDLPGTGRLREQTLALEPPRRRAYRITEGAPVDRYEAETLIEAAGDASELRWSGEVHAGDAAAEARFAALARRTLEAAVERVARAAEA